MWGARMKRLSRNKNFVVYVCGQAVSILGNNFFPVAVIVAVIQATHSTASGGLVLAAEALPMVLFTLFGGVAGDRFPRHVVMLTADVLRALTQFVMVALLLTGHVQLWAFMCVQFVYGIGSAFFEPAATGVLPQIVQEEEIPLANATLATMANIGQIIGPILAGVAIYAGGTALAVALDALSFLISAATLAFIRLPGGKVSFSSQPIFRLMKEGFAELRSTTWLLLTVFYIGVVVLVFNAPIMSLGPVVSLERFGGPATWSFMLAAFGAGSIVGSMISGRLGSALSLPMVYVGMLATLPLLLLLGGGRSGPLVIMAAAVAGIAGGAFSVTWRSRMQVAVRPEILSRVGAYLWVATVAMMPLGLAVAAPLAAHYGVAVIFTVSAACVAAASITAAVSCAILDRKACTTSASAELDRAQPN